MMDLGWVRRMSCDGLEVEAEDDGFGGGGSGGCHVMWVRRVSCDEFGGGGVRMMSCDVAGECRDGFRGGGSGGCQIYDVGQEDVM